MTDSIFRHDYLPRTGVLLLNLGTPDAPTPAALRRYLAEFLSDRRVIELPRALWWPLLHGVILNTRPRKSAHKYASIWLPEGSPLLVHTRRLTEALAGEWRARGLEPPIIDFAMRYGNPSVGQTLAAMQAQQVERLLVVPLYPQYSAASTASALDGVFQTLMRQRNMPEVRSIRHFHDHPAYIAALATHIRKHWLEHGEPDVLLLSFHGMPRHTRERGDPYFCECQKTARLLAEALELSAERLRITFQSRFGRTEWLKPYTAETLVALGRAGTHTLDVVCPGFVADCLETLEEIAIEGKATFLENGGGEYRYISCPNDDPVWVRALADIIAPHLSAWPQENHADSAEIQARARAMGATF
jgi:protoporphyrin/coproporphyrin ferrochelatase